MDFKVSARKWRPQKFSELIGQEHIVRTLANSIELNRISHAFLFSGTRGVGKTTTARILARVLNCEKGLTIEPCGACGLCNEIANGHCVDVQEIDGASNNKVEEIRELIDNVQYATSSARYKVYIIDEVHMLSKSAFNALLKTLEEPPSRVVFIFATTELIKIPETILSRCQCFEFKPLSSVQITKQLEMICEQERIQIEAKGLEEISKVATGSMRDAQSLLDQVIAYSGKNIDAYSVESVLGIVGGTTLKLFVDHIIKREPAELIGLIQEVANQGKDLVLFCRSIMEYLRNLLIIKVSHNPENLLNAHTCDLNTLKKQTEYLHADELQQMFTILSRAEMEVQRSSMGQMIFEIAILRLTETRPFKNIDNLINQINQAELVSEQPSTTLVKPNNPYVQPMQDTQSKAEPDNSSLNSSIWTKLRREVSRKRPAFEHYLDKCKMVAFNEKEIQLIFSDSFTLEMVETSENTQFIKDIVKSISGHEVEVKLKLGEIIPSSLSLNSQEKKNVNEENQNRQKTESEIIQDALDIFGGTVVK